MLPRELLTKFIDNLLMGINGISINNDILNVKSSQIYLHSAFHNTDCIKAASQYQSRQLNSVCLFMGKKRQSSLVELILM